MRRPAGGAGEAALTPLPSAANAEAGPSRTFDLDRLTSGHASDKPDSGRVLEKLGFSRSDDTTVWSLPRQTQIVRRRYAMRRPG
jgi:hypothetical protein